MLCRVRPSISEDGGGSGAALVVQPDPEDDSVVRVQFKGRQQHFEVDKVFGADSSQQQVTHTYTHSAALRHLYLNLWWRISISLWKKHPNS